MFDSSPIFVGGDNRSGTTLLSLVLDSHPELVVGPELDFLDPVDLGGHIATCCDLLCSGDPRVLGEGVETADPEWQLGVQFVRQCQRFGVEIPTVAAAARAVADTTEGAVRSFADRARVVDALGEHRRRASGARRWGIKIQHHIVRAGEFAALWPRAQFIHIVRDGRDVAASHLASGKPWAYATVVEAAAGWRGVVDGARRACPADRVADLRYEDLIEDPQRVMARLLRFLGVAWDDAVLRHHDAPHALIDRPFGHPSAADAVRPFFSDAVGRFRREMAPGAVTDFERVAAGTLQRYGYVTSTPT